MGMTLPFVDILIFAIIAIFLGLRLRNILGSRDGYEQTPEELGKRGPKSDLPHAVRDSHSKIVEEAEKVVPLRPSAESGSGIAAIKKADPSFDEAQFMQGAASAFSMVLHAFAEGDLSQLRRLLGYDLFNEFSDAIRSRNAENESLALTVDSIDDVQLLDGELVDGIASVTVRFVSQQTRRLVDADGNEMVDDSADHEAVIDVWTFERDTQIADPNWKLVETATEGEDDG